MDLAQGCAVVVVSLAAVIDVRSRRIPNWVTFGGLGLGIVVNAYLYGANGVLGALAGTLLGAAMLLPFYVFGAVGAGDVKLLAAVGALLGPRMLVSVAIYGAIVGGLMSLIVLVWSGRLRLIAEGLLSSHRLPTLGRATAPYGVAIASGVYLSMFLPGVVG
jgi:prepilin peptidase CpaA